jgi:hypothetical protein
MPGFLCCWNNRNNWKYNWATDDWHRNNRNHRYNWDYRNYWFFKYHWCSWTNILS